MNKLHHILLILLGLSTGLNAQNQPVTYKIDGAWIFASVVKVLPQTSLDSIAVSFGFEDWQHTATDTSALGWFWYKQTEKSYVLVRNKNNSTKPLPNAYVIGQPEPLANVQPAANYGVNNFKQQTVFQQDNKTVFTLIGFTDARNVYLSGSFNGWSTLKTSMKKSATGWQISLPLPPGKHLYKFVVDGRWIHDKFNKNREDDGNGGHNSVYFVYNYTFVLKNHSQAHKVEVAGSFSDWRELRMHYHVKQKQWQLPMYLRQGTHAYKFVVDGNWILDPANNTVRDDGAGNKNNFMGIGDSVYFKLAGHQNAQSVFVAGDFNGWNFGELQMQKAAGGWVLPYVLGPGNYAYKFLVDGTYLVDPQNPILIGEDDYRNSVLVIEPNVTFTLPGYASAKHVLLSGTFNGWSTSGYTMQNIDGIWQIKIYLPEGKHAYKFIVDGNWILDPNNKLYEPNQFNSQNSIIWVEVNHH